MIAIVIVGAVVAEAESCQGRTRKPQRSAGSEATEPADIVFLVDNSASMDAVIADLRNNINAFANLVNQGKRGNLRIGGAAIREWDYGWNKVPLTEDIGHFQRWLSGVNTESAQTHPLDAIDWATKEFQWRPNAHRIIIIIGNDDGSGNQASASHYLNVHQIKLFKCQLRASVSEQDGRHTGEKIVRGATQATG